MDQNKYIPKQITKSSDQDTKFVGLRFDIIYIERIFELVYDHLFIIQKLNF